MGHSQDIDLRIARHNRGETISTRHGIPWELVMVKPFDARAEAMQWERSVKARGIARYLGDLKV